MAANGEIIRQATNEYPGREAVAQAAPLPQFFRGFEGAAIEPFPDAARKVLAEPPDPRDVEIKPDGIVFLPGVAYRRILTRAFGAGGWSILPRSPARVMDNIVVYHGALVCLGRFVAEAVGECFLPGQQPEHELRQLRRGREDRRPVSLLQAIWVSQRTCGTRTGGKSGKKRLYARPATRARTGTGSPRRCGSSRAG